MSEPEIRAFSGSLGAAKANKGVFVTTSYFTKPAMDFAEKHPFKMILIGGNQLTNLMMRHNVGVRVSETFHLKKIDGEFFSDDKSTWNPMLHMSVRVRRGESRASFRGDHG